MSAMSERDLRQKRRNDPGGSGLPLDPEDDVGDLTAIAKLLGGEIDGRFVRIPSPGCDAEDRSCFVRIDPARPREFFIYDCAGSKPAAYAAVREKLGQVEARPPVDHSPVALKAWHESEPAS